MALIKCPECGKEVSEKAEVCIGCGCPISEQEELNKIVLVKVSENRVKTLELIIEIGDLDFLQAKYLMKTLPSVICDGLVNRDADIISNKFLSLGNVVRIEASHTKNINNILKDISKKKKKMIEYEKNKMDKEKAETGKIKCPKCGSTQIQAVTRKWSIGTGLFTNKVDRVCLNCKNKF